jgi:hypothetical protein
MIVVACYHSFLLETMIISFIEASQFIPQLHLRVELGDFLTNYVKNTTLCFNHWCSELVAAYDPLIAAKHKKAKPFKPEDVIKEFDTLFDINTDIEGIKRLIESAIEEVNDSEQTNFSITDVNIEQVRTEMLQLLSLVTTQDWNKSHIKEILQDYNTL